MGKKNELIICISRCVNYENINTHGNVNAKLMANSKLLENYYLKLFYRNIRATPMELLF